MPYRRCVPGGDHSRYLSEPGWLSLVSTLAGAVLRDDAPSYIVMCSLDICAEEDRFSVILGALLYRGAAFGDGDDTRQLGMAQTTRSAPVCGLQTTGSPAKSCPGSAKYGRREGLR
jgi:hypothetical protein